MPVPPEAVWAVLATPGAYGYWVVGSKYIRDADAAFPAVGTKLHHTIGVGPLTLNDHTEVLAADAPHYLKLRAKGRRFSGHAFISTSSEASFLAALDRT